MERSNVAVMDYDFCGTSARFVYQFERVRAGYRGSALARHWQGVNVASLPAANHFVRSNRVGFSNNLLKKRKRCVGVQNLLED